MGNLSGFNAETVEPNVAFEPLPAGEYQAAIINSEMTPTKNGQGKYLMLELEILDKRYAGRKVWDRLNLINANDKAVEIAKATLSSICRAVGVLTPGDSSDLHGRPLVIKLIVSSDPQYGDRNEVKGYRKSALTDTQPDGSTAKWPPDDDNPF